MKFSHKAIEKKWQKFWKENDCFKTIKKYKHKIYILDMFPYPSGAGLHVGHVKGYTASDVYARFKRMNHFNVLHPIGFDSFGLPAEQYALKTNHDPRVFTQKNILNFKNQILRLGFSYDLNKIIDTSKPFYYKYTQYIFTLFFQHRLAVLKRTNVNWCPKLNSVLANEEIIFKNNHMVSKRGEFLVYKKLLKQWVLRISSYSNKLLNNLDSLNWSSAIKKMQRNWIGKTDGYVVSINVFEKPFILKVFSTRIDAFFGITYIAIAPELSIVEKLIKDNQELMNRYHQFLNKISQIPDLERINDHKEKNGLFLNCYAINPVNKQKIPIFVADYVLKTFATGIEFGIAGHSLRDYKFALKYNLAINYIIKPVKNNNIASFDGPHINSDFLNSLNIKDASKKVFDLLEEKKIIIKKTFYKLNDWVFSRQRYWGEPIPIIYLNYQKATFLQKKELPLKLPILDYKRWVEHKKLVFTPLSLCQDWVSVKNKKDKIIGIRETNVMPQWAGSCWYFIAYILKQKNNSILDFTTKKAFKELQYWLPVDLYIGGQEHAVSHLLYARFWNRFLYDLNLVPYQEPFVRLLNQGMILGSDNEKMSKSKMNTVSPDEIIESHGADALRVYEMFAGPLKQTSSWNSKGLDGARKWLAKVYVFFENVNISKRTPTKSFKFFYFQKIKEITNHFENLEFNSALAKLMTLLNKFIEIKTIPLSYCQNFVKMFACFAPHLGEELWNRINNFATQETLTYALWPKYDQNFLDKYQEIKIVVKINNKFKTIIVINEKYEDFDLYQYILKSKKIQELLKNQKFIRLPILISNKIINFFI